MGVREPFKAITTCWELLRKTYQEFQLNDPLRLAAATSFFASFALPPILIILTEILGIFANPGIIRHGLLDQLGIALDKNIALQVRGVLHNIHYLSLNQGQRIAGFIFLLFVATTLFGVIRNSLNQVWKIRAKAHQGILFMLLHRVRSVGIILIAGILFFIVLLFDTVKWQIPARIDMIFYHMIALLAAMTWFTLVLKYLSYGKPAWKTVMAGGAFTGLLFIAGTTLLHLVFSYNGMKTIYGASTSLVLLLLFVFYCSFIFYFGACFTLVLANYTNRPILPTRHAEPYI